MGRYAPLSINDLARAANQNKGQASRSAQALVERNLVRKETSKTDARGVLLTPTDTGQARYAQIAALIARRNDEIFGCLSPQEQAQLGKMLDRIIAHLGDGPAGRAGEKIRLAAPTRQRPIGRAHPLTP